MDWELIALHTHLTDYAVWDCSPADVAPAWTAIGWAGFSISQVMLLPVDPP